MADDSDKPVPMNIRIRPSVKRRFHLYAVERGVTMTDILLAHIDQLLSEKPPKPPKPAK